MNARVKGLSINSEIEQEIIDCACGCGTKIERYYKSRGYWHERKYVHNHHRKGKRNSEKQKNAAREACKSPEWREAYIQGMEKRKLNPNWQKTVTVDASIRKWDKRGRRERVTLHCDQCGKKIKRLPEHIRETLNFCSHECSGLYHSKENHPFYTGGTNDYPPGWASGFKKKIRKRDNRQCVVCKTKDKVLSVHHIDKNKQNISPSNLITVCNSCHRKVHNGTAQLPVEYVEQIKSMPI